MLTQTRTYTFEDFLKFYERLGEVGGFEFLDGVTWNKFAEKPVDESIANFILSDEFDPQKLPLFQTMPTQFHDRITKILHYYLMQILYLKGFIVYLQKTTIPETEKEQGFREPDLVIVEKDIEKRNKYQQVINPVMLVEVLSKSTKHIDLAEKLLGIAIYIEFANLFDSVARPTQSHCLYP